MTNLTERLDKHLQSIREGNGKISPKELFQLLKRKEIKSLLTSKHKELYPVQLIDWALDMGEGDADLEMFADSTCGNGQYDFMAYCICKYLNIDSGINSNQAYNCVAKLLTEQTKEYKSAIKEDGLVANIEYLKQHPEEETYNIDGVDRDCLNNWVEYCKKEGYNIKDVVITCDWDAAELLNPLLQIWDDVKFAKLCGDSNLANKIKPLADKAKWMYDRIIDIDIIDRQDRNYYLK